VAEPSLPAEAVRLILADAAQIKTREALSVTPKRYTIILANRTTGTMHRFVISLRPTLAATALLLSLPILIGLGARWSVRSELWALRTNTATLEQEVASYRAATGELIAQVTTLQSAIEDVGRQSVLDPQSSAALTRLQGILRHQGAGGTAADRPTRLTSALALPEDPYGTLRLLLGQLESRLQVARTDAARRAELAAATPSIWPVTGWLSGTFGQRTDPVGGRGREFHPGIDISVPGGTPIRATAAGTVVSTGYVGNYGNMVAIDHGHGVMTRYAHLSGFSVKPGDVVERNRVIGYAGATGRTTGSHLHYELLINGVQTDPLRLLASPR
jgi:murein DD-endopeptidase MepM/ murein hydrolase activator NlpD